jgi:hypothetical protein
VRSPLVTGLLVSALAIEVLAHVALLFGLFARRPRWRGLVALVVPPLAPLWGWQEGMHVRVYAWLTGLVSYAIGVALAA